MAVARKPEVTDPLAPVRAMFVAAAEQQIIETEGMLAAVRGRTIAADQALAAIGRIAHKVSGVAGALGFAHLGEIAGRLDRRLAQKDTTAETRLAAEAPLIELFLDALEETLED